jgi:hypothetical protein
MPEARQVFSPERQQERKQLLKDPVARALLKNLIVGPGDRPMYELVTSAARLFQLGISLLEIIEGSAETPTARDLGLRRHIFRHIRRGDRLRLDDTDVWTDLSDGAVVEASFLLDKIHRGSDVANAIQSMTPSGLRSAGLNGVLCLLFELDPGERVRLAEALSRPTREIRPASLDRKELQRIAKALHTIARHLEE